MASVSWKTSTPPLSGRDPPPPGFPRHFLRLACAVGVPGWQVSPEGSTGIARVLMEAADQRFDPQVPSACDERSDQYDLVARATSQDRRIDRQQHHEEVALVCRASAIASSSDIRTMKAVPGTSAGHCCLGRPVGRSNRTDVPSTPATSTPISRAHLPV